MTPTEASPISREVFLAAIAMGLVTRGANFTAWIGETEVPRELIREIGKETSLIWATRNLMFRSDWLRTRGVNE